MSASTTVFIHTQETPASTWNITHDLGCKPIVEVVVDVSGSIVKMQPNKVEHVDDDTMQLTFTTARSGIARLIGLKPIS